MNQRQIGGRNNKQGNRYEDIFATYKLLQFASKHVDQAIDVRIKEQACCFVDDLIIEEPTLQHFYQLKSGGGVTWGAGNGKLEREFRDQFVDCKRRGIRFKLVIVVSDSGRKQSLQINMPRGIKMVTSVFVFPILARPSDLIDHRRIIQNRLKLISASRFDSRAAHQSIVEAFYYDWIDHAPDPDGFCVLENVIASIRAKNACPIRHTWQDNTGKWVQANALLLRISDLKFWTDRGHFEWRYLPFGMQGIVREPCLSQSFTRFMDRVIAKQPQTFDDFEGLLP